jgi:hypothetical protein
MTALNNFNERIGEFYQQAVDCERQADAQNDPKVKKQFLELKRLWLLLAHHLSCAPHRVDLEDERGRRPLTAKLLTRDEARRLPGNIAKLPELMR